MEKSTNLRSCSTENSEEIRVIFRNSEKETVLCALLIDRVIGPYYFYDPIVTSVSYLHSLNNYFHPMLLDLLANTILQHDEAPQQYSQAVRDLLDKGRPDSWIRRGFPANCPAFSPDLTPLDFFLSGFVKGNVVRTTYTSSIPFQHQITSTVQNIRTDLPQNA